MTADARLARNDRAEQPDAVRSLRRRQFISLADQVQCDALEAVERPGWCPLQVVHPRQVVGNVRARLGVLEEADKGELVEPQAGVGEVRVLVELVWAEPGGALSGLQ